jgi:hypothetical protein
MEQGQEVGLFCSRYFVSICSAILCLCVRPPGLFLGFFSSRIPLDATGRGIVFYHSVK